MRTKLFKKVDETMGEVGEMGDLTEENREEMLSPEAQARKEAARQRREAENAKNQQALAAQGQEVGADSNAVIDLTGQKTEELRGLH